MFENIQIEGKLRHEANPLSERRKDIIMEKKLSSIQISEDPSIKETEQEEFQCDISTAYYEGTSCLCSRNSTCMRFCPCVKSGKKCDNDCHGPATKTKCENK